MVDEYNKQIGGMFVHNSAIGGSCVGFYNGLKNLETQDMDLNWDYTDDLNLFVLNYSNTIRMMFDSYSSGGTGLTILCITPYKGTLTTRNGSRPKKFRVVCEAIAMVVNYYCC